MVTAARLVGSTNLSPLECSPIAVAGMDHLQKPHDSRMSAHGRTFCGGNKPNDQPLSLVLRVGF